MFDDRGNHFPPLEAAAEAIAAELGAAPAEMNHAIAERLRADARADGDGAAAGRRAAPLRSGRRACWHLSETLPRESRGFHMAFQLALLEAREAVRGGAGRCRALVAGSRHADPRRPAQLRRRRAADAVRRLPRRGARRCATTWRRWRRASACRSSRRAIGCRRCSGRARAACRSSSCASIRRATCRSGSPPRAFRSRAIGGSCPRWVVHTAFSQPGAVQVQVAELPDGAAYLCFARTVTRPARALGRPAADACRRHGLRHRARRRRWHMPTGWTWSSARVGIGLSCRLCDRPDCRSRAFPPLEHRLALDPKTAGVAPYRFETRRG